MLRRERDGWREANGSSRRPPERKSCAGDRDIIPDLIRREAAEGRVYTARRFSEVFENRQGLNGSRSLRERLNALAVRGVVTFFKNAPAYGLDAARRSRQGFLCVKGMTLKDGTKVRPTHFRDPETGAILPMETNQKEDS
jgi:hypothetical protein